MGAAPHMAIDRYPKLEIPQTLAAGPGPGHTDERVLQAFATAGVADHMQSDVLRGLIECKHMLRELWGTTNIHTFAVAGTGWSGLDAMFSAILSHHLLASTLISMLTICS